jgi:hypothetical protein
MTTTTRPRDYSQGKIYKLECLTTGKVYIGSTTKQYLSQRLAQHISHYKQWKNGKCCYITSFEILEADNYQMTLLESCACESVDQLHAMERHFIKSMDCVNKVIPNRTDDDRRDYRKAYRHNNINIFRERDRQYYLTNSDRILDRNRRYREANREKVADHKSEKITCPCGATVSRGCLLRHERTKKHQLWLTSQSNSTINDNA